MANLCEKKFQSVRDMGSSYMFGPKLFGVGPPVKVRASARLYPIISYIQGLVKKKKKINMLHAAGIWDILGHINLTERSHDKKVKRRVSTRRREAPRDPGQSGPVSEGPEVRASGR